MDQHVLVPVDTSSSSEPAFEYVLEAIPGATITLFHALNPVTVLNYVTAEGFDYDRAKHKERERREAAERTFEAYREKAAARDREIETVIEAGAPAEKILEYVERRDIDHIVMGSRGRSGLEEVMIGSVAKAVVKRSSVPVTIVP
jgi:nucleotide-binding universal stress UspA family protein